MKTARILKFFFKTISLLFTAFAVILILSIVFPKFGNKINAIRCVLKGGSWGRGETPICTIYYKDAGKECTSKKDCLGLCLAQNKDSLKGTCSKNNIYYGEICRLNKDDKPAECFLYDPF